MKQITINKLIAAHIICDDEDRSTEYLLQWLQDMANVSLECVMKYIIKDYYSTYLKGSEKEGQVLEVSKYLLEFEPFSSRNW